MKGVSSFVRSPLSRSSHGSKARMDAFHRSIPPIAVQCLKSGCCLMSDRVRKKQSSLNSFLSHNSSRPLRICIVQRSRQRKQSVNLHTHFWSRTWVLLTFRQSQRGAQRSQQFRVASLLQVPHNLNSAMGTNGECRLSGMLPIFPKQMDSKLRNFRKNVYTEESYQFIYLAGSERRSRHLRKKLEVFGWSSILQILVKTCRLTGLAKHLCELWRLAGEAEDMAHAQKNTLPPHATYLHQLIELRSLLLTLQKLKKFLLSNRKERLGTVHILSDMESVRMLQKTLVGWKSSNFFFSAWK